MATEEEKQKKADEEEERLGQQARQTGNRVVGLGSYAMGVCILAFIGIGIYDNPRAAMKDWKTMAMFALGALVCFAIGYTPNAKKVSRDP